MVEPAARDVASPAAPMVATAVFDDLHVTCVVRSCVLLSEKVPMAVNCRVKPRGMLSAEGVIAIDLSRGAVMESVVDSVTLPKVALIVVKPTDREVASPVVPMVATLKFDEVHTACRVRSCATLFDKVPVAVNCWVVPRTMLGSTGVIDRDATVATVRLAVPETLSKDAVTVTEPVVLEEAFASPFEPGALLMVAIASFDELQSAQAVRFCVPPPGKIPVAINC